MHISVLKEEAIDGLNIRDGLMLSMKEEDFDKVYDVNWMKGRESISLRPKEHILVLDGNEEIKYGKLLIATGSHTFIPPIKGLSEADNYIGFRNIDDIEVLKEVPKTAKNIVVLGSGLIGIDCATGYLHMGVKVTLVDFAGWLLNRQLDERAAKTYIDAFKENGVEQYYGVGVNEVHVKDGKIYEIELSDGKVLPCDYFVVTAGVRSNVEFLQDSGLELSKFGLVYDETGKTSDPDVYGAGDVSGTSPIWPVAVKEGMDREEAMRAVTKYPAEICGLSDRIGSLEKGKDADIVVFSSDPLDIMSRVMTVVINGKVVKNCFCDIV